MKKKVYYDKDKEPYKELIEDNGIEYIPVSNKEKYKLLITDILKEDDE